MPDIELSRDNLGRLVREIWLDWAKTQPNVPPEWQVTFDELPEADRELGCMIGEGLASRFRDEMDQLRIQRDESREQAETFRDLCRRTCGALREYWWGYPMTTVRSSRVRAIIGECRAALGLESESQDSIETEGGGA